MERLVRNFGNLIIKHPEKTVIDIFNAFMQGLTDDESIELVKKHYIMFLSIGDDLRNSPCDLSVMLFNLENRRNYYECERV